MPRYIQDKEGHFAGSIGDGRDLIPSASDIPAGLATLDAGTAVDQTESIGAIYQKFADTKAEDTRTTSSPEFTRPAAADPETSPTTLAWLARASNDNPTLVAAAGNPSTPPDALDHLVDRFHPEAHETVLAEVARNPHTRPATLERLAGYTRSQRILAHVAGNPATPPARIGALAEHREAPVRCFAAWNPKLPAEHIDRLSREDDVDIRHGIAENPAADADTLLRLGARTTEEDLFVRGSARGNKNYPKTETRTTWAADPGISDARLLSLAGDNVPAVQRAVIANPRVSAGMLTSMSTSSSIAVRADIASHPATPTATLESMLADEQDKNVAATLTRRLGL